VKKKDIAKERLLQAAALQMNLEGAASVNLVSVSNALGMSPNSLYHYVKNRGDLVYQTYLRAGECLATDLQLIKSNGGSASAKLQALTKLHLSTERGEHVVLKHPEALPPAECKAIVKLHQSNVDSITAIIADGIENNEFRRVNPAIASQLVIGMMDWAQLWYRWTYDSAEKAIEKRSKAALAINDILLHGICVNPMSTIAIAPSLESISKQDFDFFDTKSVNERKRLRIIGAASRLFNTQGIKPTSIDDVAAAINASKGAIYHYFDNKNELLNACYEHTFDMFDLFISNAEAISENSGDTIPIILQFHCQANASLHPPVLPQRAMSTLPKDFAKRILAISQRLYDLQSTAVKEKTVSIESRAVIDLSLGASTWVHNWLRENPSISTQSLTTEICSIFTEGLVPRSSSPTGTDKLTYLKHRRS
jgi:AcrR family transcriptional regulator